MTFSGLRQVSEECQPRAPLTLQWLQAFGDTELAKALRINHLVASNKKPLTICVLTVSRPWHCPNAASAGVERTEDHVGLAHPGVWVPGQDDVGALQLGIDLHRDVGQVLLAPGPRHFPYLCLVGGKALAGNAQVAV